MEATTRTVQGGDGMRLIDADALMDDINGLKKSPWYNNAFRIDFLNDINDSRFVRSEAIDIVQRLCIDDAPTIDAVEVVRCKDCQWRADIIDVDTGEMYHTCGVLGVEVDDERYCSYGERKEGE